MNGDGPGLRWFGNTSHFEQVTLPWTTAESMQRDGTWPKVGIDASVYPPRSRAWAGCSSPLTAQQGRRADHQGGKSNQYSTYALKD
ncbi:hypothetical protein [Streptomyces sp. NPDC007172]|uniref:hypothetical protein n=1 Tax=Streptomyces sp. NPDC007172 TaxID=3364776 RepID=UPI003697B6D6